MTTMPDGHTWATFSKANYADEADAVACHERYVKLICAGRWQECEGNDRAIIEAYDEREGDDGDDD